jgi:hypothetical protein
MVWIALGAWLATMGGLLVSARSSFGDVEPRPGLR